MTWGTLPRIGYAYESIDAWFDVQLVVCLQRSGLLLQDLQTFIRRGGRRW